MRPARTCGPLVWYSLRALKRIGFLPFLNITVSAVRDGRLLRVPIRGGIGIPMLVDQEPWMTPLLKGLMPRFPGTFMDVGVNVGQTLTRVKMLDATRAFVGFEPNPICAQYATRLALAQGYTDWTIMPVGLADRGGAASLDLHDVSLDDTSATTVANFRPGHTVHHRIPIAVRRLDDVAKDLGMGRIGLVKIDVEGGEYEVLLGARERVRSDRPAIILEILPVGDRPARLPRQQAVERFFGEHRYVLYRIDSSVDRPRLERISSPIGILQDERLSNYLALPEEVHAVTISDLEKPGDQQ